jgi:DNA polymerase III epsilon subunit-like protein
MRNILAFDTETTGIPKNFKDYRLIDQEILQVGMIDGNSNIVFNKMVRPSERTKWPDAECVNGISYAMVKNKRPIEYWRAEIQTHIDVADLLVAFNYNFDYLFLRAAGIKFSGKQYFDVMKVFAQRHGTRDCFGRYRYSSLKKCASYYGYRIEGAHDAIADAKATLFCYRKLCEEMYG